MQAKSAGDGEARGSGTLPALKRLASHHQPAAGAHPGGSCRFLLISVSPHPLCLRDCAPVTLMWILFVYSVPRSHVHEEYLTHDHQNLFLKEEHCHFIYAHHIQGIDHLKRKSLFHISFMQFINYCPLCVGDPLGEWTAPFFMGQEFQLNSVC